MIKGFAAATAAVVVGAGVWFLVSQSAVWAVPASSVRVNSIHTLSAGNQYYCGDSVSPTGPLDGTTCTAYFDADNGELYLYNYNGDSITVDSGSLFIHLQGANYIDTYAFAGIWSANGDNIVISSGSGGTLDIATHSSGGNRAAGIQSADFYETVFGQVAITGSANVNINAVSGEDRNARGIWAGSVVVQDSASLEISARTNSSNANMAAGIATRTNGFVQFNTTGDIIIDTSGNSNDTLAVDTQGGAFSIYSAMGNAGRIVLAYSGSGAGNGAGYSNASDPIPTLNYGGTNLWNEDYSAGMDIYAWNQLTKIPINTVNVTVTAPVAGNHPDFSTAIAGDPTYTVKLHTWATTVGDSINPTWVFDSMWSYRVYVTVTPKAGYYLAYTSVLINGLGTIKADSPANTYYGTLKAPTPADDTAPVLSAGSSNRTDYDEATISFTTNEAGTLYCTILDAGDPAPTAIQARMNANNCDPEVVAAGTVSGKELLDLGVDGARDVYIIVQDAAGNYSEPLLISLAAYVPPGPALTGVATIDNTSPKIGDSLTASLGSTNNTGSLSYLWKADDSAVGTNASSYTVQTADLGKTITVSIYSSIENGSITSGATSAVVKKDAGSPVSPVLSSKTDISVTLTAVSGYEYTRDGGTTWQGNVFTGLSASTSYTFNQRIAETADTYASGNSSGLTVSTNATPPAALTGTAVISNTSPKIGDSLTASLDSGNNSGTLSYQWKAGGSNVGTNSASYTVVVGDLGKTITVTISSSVETGSVESAATSAVVKKDAGSPVGPGLASKTDTSVTLSTAAGHEYTRDGGTTWQDNVFTGLSANTSYTFNQRIAETADTYASVMSADLTVTTTAAPPAALTGTAVITNTAPKIGDNLGVNLDYTNNTGTLSYQWKVGGVNAGTGASYTVVVGDLGKTITVSITSSVETGTVVSAATSAVVKKSAAQPPVLTLDTKTYNSITVFGTVGHEYSKDNGSTWQSSPIFTGLSANTGYNLVQRTLETADTYLSIPSASLSVTTDVMPPNALTGTVSISKTAPRVGDILTAATATNNTGIISYQWKVGGVNAGTGAVYEVQSADMGKTITVTVTSSVETGAVMSAATAAVVDYTYTIISGNNGSWTQGSTSDYVFVIDGPYSGFMDVVVDGGTTLTVGTDYNASDGSTIVSLKAGFLNTLAVGDHDIEFWFHNTNMVAGQFRVNARGTSDTNGGTNPLTGDVNIFLIIISSLIALTGIMASTLTLKKFTNKR